MLVSKIGDDLAVRLSADDAARLGLKEGDQVEIRRTAEQPQLNPDGSQPPLITDPAERKAALESLLRFRGMMPADFKFNRDEANER
jgi:antitoxin MazE